MNHGQGFTANLLTAVIVVNASLLGMPVSTTHVSCGSIFGVGLLTQQADYSMIGKILASWVFTLPVGALLGAASFSVMRLVVDAIRRKVRADRDRTMSEVTVHETVR